MEHYKSSALQIDYPEAEVEMQVEAATVEPITMEDGPAEYWDLTLDEAIQHALANSKVLRDLGGLVLQAPDSVATLYGPAISETDPRFGVDATLSAFDALFRGGTYFENNDRPLNNVFFGGGTRQLQQDLHSYQAELSKTTGMGGHFAIRKIIDYDMNNSPGNADPNLPWTVQTEAEFRQPLLQGAGVDFNQIAGPGSSPGAINGVLIARIDTDISLADFEIGVRNLVSDAESAYWELYFAYRDLDAKTAAYNRALDTWRNVNALFRTGRLGGEADKEARAREQLFRLEEEVQNALAGRAQDRIRTTIFRGTGGVYTTERRLRLLLGLPINDGRLIRPADEPMMARAIFHWEEIVAEALTRRAELRKQKWQIRRRELELLASKNFLLPRVDAVGRYRFRGLGHDLINSTRQPMRFDSAFQDLTTGDHQEWQLGVEVTLPVGYRQAHAAVQHAEWSLARERAILAAQEKDVTHDLTAAFGEAERAHRTAQTNLNRRQSALEELTVLESNFQDAEQQEQNNLLNSILDAQRRLAEAETNYFRALIENTLAARNVHLQKGSLLEYNGVYLSEGPWPQQAYGDAEVRDANRYSPGRLLNYVISRPPPITGGAYPQRMESGMPLEQVPPMDTAPSGTPVLIPVPSADTAAVAEPAETDPLRPAAWNASRKQTAANSFSPRTPPERLRRQPAAQHEPQVPEYGSDPSSMRMLSPQSLVIDRSETTSASGAMVPPRRPPLVGRPAPNRAQDFARPGLHAVRTAVHLAAPKQAGSAGTAGVTAAVGDVTEMTPSRQPTVRYAVPPTLQQTPTPSLQSRPSAVDRFSPWSTTEWRPSP